MLKKISKWWRRQNWNRIVQEFSAILIGLGVGLYGYESKVALVPMKWQIDRKVAQGLHHQQQPQKPASPNSPWRDIFQSPVVKQFLEKSNAQRYVEHFDLYDKVMEKHGIKGGLKKQVDGLMRNGVEPIPQKWKAKENRPFVILGLSLLITAIVIKFLIYFAIVDFNRLKGRKKRGKRKRHADWNGLLQEFSTLGLSAIGGLYAPIAADDFLRGEPTTYPYPIVGLCAFLLCIIVKIAVATRFVDFNSWSHSSGRLVSAKRARQVSRNYNWNNLVQQMATAILGVGIGFYAYESNLALLPLKWQTDSKVAKKVAAQQAPPASSSQQKNSFFDKLKGFTQQNPAVNEFWKKSGAERYMQHAEKYNAVLEDAGIKGKLKTKMQRLSTRGVEPIPEKWTTKQNMPYLIASLVILMLSALTKIFIYMQIVDCNRLFRRGKKRKKSRSKRRVQWNEMLHEFTTIILSAMVGLYTDAILDWLAGEQQISYPYPQAGPIILGSCLLLKMMLYIGLINFNRRRHPAKASAQKNVNKLKRR